MKLFDYIKILFGKDTEWNTLTNYDKSKNSFMVRRFMSIKFPIQAQLFNILKIDSIGEAESWRLLSSKFNKVPAWIYTKVKKEKDVAVWIPDENLSKIYMDINEIGEREFNEALKYNKEYIKKSLELLEKQL